MNSTYNDLDPEVQELEVELPTARFTVEPAVLIAALKETGEALRQKGEILYAAVSADASSDLYQHSLIAPSAGTGRLVIGASGGRDYVFADVPVTGTEEASLVEGEFIFNEGGKLLAFAQEATRPITIEFYHSGEPYFVLHHGVGYKKLRIPLYYEEEDIASTWFHARDERFETPEASLSSAALGNLVNRAEKVAGSFSASEGGRTGDLVFYPSYTDEGGADVMGSVEFVTFTTSQQHSIGTRMAVPMDTEYDLAWEVAPEHLKSLSKALKAEEATYHIHTEQLEQDGVHVPGLSFFHLAYNRAVIKGSEELMYVHRRMLVARDSEALKSWSTDPTDRDVDQVLFGDPECKVFVAAPSAPFFSAANRVWALDPAAMIQLEPDYRDGDHSVLALLSGDQEDRDRDEVDATHGQSQVPFLLLHPDVARTMSVLLDGAIAFQIRSFPDLESKDANGVRIPGELHNAMLVHPIGADQNPTAPIIDPDRYILVVWQ